MNYYRVKFSSGPDAVVEASDILTALHLAKLAETDRILGIQEMSEREASDTKARIFR